MGNLSRVNYVLEFVTDVNDLECKETSLIIKKIELNKNGIETLKEYKGFDAEVCMSMFMDLIIKIDYNDCETTELDTECDKNEVK